MLNMCSSWVWVVGLSVMGIGGTIISSSERKLIAGIGQKLLCYVARDKQNKQTNKQKEPNNQIVDSPNHNVRKQRYVLPAAVPLLLACASQMVMLVGRPCSIAAATANPPIGSARCC